ncbi:MAG: FixH family protein [Rhizobiaceae bacterium]
MNTPTSEARPFTGRHLLFIMLVFFGTIIAVNVTMATFAARSWTGLVVKNSYVASQEFNGKAQAEREQIALGWTSTLNIGGGKLRFALSDAKGGAVALKGGSATLYHPVSGLRDTHLDLRPDGSGAVAADIALDDGGWIIEIAADASLERPYRDVRRVFISSGELR